MSCGSCGGKGFVDGYHAAGASFTPNIEQCPKKCNITGYSDEVQRRLNDPHRVTAHQALRIIQEPRNAQVIPLSSVRKETKNE
jgi:hypothetical protein